MWLLSELVKTGRRLNKEVLGMKEKEIVCPWCNGVTRRKENKQKKAQSDVVEARCDKCGKILAAYKNQEGDFLPRIKVF